jgi:hypothetical protein
MQTKQQEENHAEGEKQLRQQLQAIIGEQVMQILGQPGGLHRVQVRKLWDDCYRVNVYTGRDAASAIVAHSYFLVTDGQGNIVGATPRITKHY